MNEQRRTQLKRMRRDRIRRCAVRNGVERLESRVLPGGFLDLLAGAAIVSTFDLLGEEELTVEALESPTDTVALEVRPAKARPQISSSLWDTDFVDTDFAPQEERFESMGTDGDWSIEPSTPVATSIPSGVSLIDAFFAEPQFVDLPETSIGRLSQPVSPLPSWSPLPQMSGGTVANAGTGGSTTSAGSSPSTGGSANSGFTSIPAHLLGEGEGNDVPEPGPDDAPASDPDAEPELETTDVSGTGVVANLGPDGEYSVTYFTCSNLPSQAAPMVFYRQTGSTTNIDDANFEPTVHTLNDAADEGVIIGTAGADETQDFPLPADTPFLDDSITPWLEVTSYKHWEEYHHVLTRANGNPIKAYENDHTMTVFKSYSVTNATAGSVKVSREVATAAEIQVVNIESVIGSELELSREFITESSAGETITKTEKIQASPCQTVGKYQKFEIIEVTMKYVHYADEFGPSWTRTPNAFFNLTGQTATVTIRSYKTPDVLFERSAPGVLTFHAVENQ